MSAHEGAVRAQDHELQTRLRWRLRRRLHSRRRVSQVAADPGHEQVAAPAPSPAPSAARANRNNVKSVRLAPHGGAPHAGHAPHAQMAVRHGGKRNARRRR